MEECVDRSGLNRLGSMRRLLGRYKNAVPVQMIMDISNVADSVRIPVTETKQFPEAQSIFPLSFEVHNLR